MKSEIDINILKKYYDKNHETVSNYNIGNLVMLSAKNIYINRLTKKNGLSFFKPFRHHGKDRNKSL
jgi:hypothetical protein